MYSVVLNSHLMFLKEVTQMILGLTPVDAGYLLFVCFVLLCSILPCLVITGSQGVLLVCLEISCLVPEMQGTRAGALQGHKFRGSAGVHVQGQCRGTRTEAVQGLGHESQGNKVKNIKLRNKTIVQVL
jgi:hypothetical protein